MQNRYVSDIGDYLKLGILRASSPGYRLGIAWWLYPDESHNRDGRHTATFIDQTSGGTMIQKYSMLWDEIVSRARGMSDTGSGRSHSGINLFCRVDTSYGERRSERSEECGRWFSSELNLVATERRRCDPP